MDSFRLYLFTFTSDKLTPWCVASHPAMRYVGVSAGAILAGPTCDTAYWKGWDDPLVVPQEAREESLVSWI